MKKNCNTCTRVILAIIIFLYFATPSVARSENVAEVVSGGCKHIEDCTNNAIRLALESAAMEEELYSGYPKGYDPYDPIAMGEVDLVDPWEAYRAQQEEEMDRAMAEEVQRAWQEYNEPQPDISDKIIKP